MSLANEKLIPLKDVPHLPLLERFRGTGKRPINNVTPYRWGDLGVRGVVLETTRVGGRIATSEEAVVRFFERLEKRRSLGSPPTTGQRAAEIEEISVAARKETARRPRRQAVGK